MTAETAVTRNLYMREGSSDKVYNVSLEPQDSGWVVKVVRGRRGNTLITDSKTAAGPVPYDKALGIFTKTVNEKLGKGYKEAEGTEVSPVYTAPEAREQTDLVAMLLNEIDEDGIETIVCSPAWWMQEKMDGRRMIIHVENKLLKAVNRRGQTCGLPQSVEAGVLALGDDIIVDGECVGERFYAFDILSFRGVNLREHAYRDRIGLLDGIEENCRLNSGGLKSWSVVNTYRTEEEKRYQLKFVRAQGGEGVVFKRHSAHYAPGRPASGGSSLKLKFVKTLSAIVTAVNNKRSVSLGLLNDDNEPVPMGNVTVPANQPIPKSGDIVEVRYLYCNRGGSLYQPFLIGIRDDLPVQACTMGQVKYKSEAEIAEDDAVSAPSL